MGADFMLAAVEISVSKEIALQRLYELTPDEIREAVEPLCNPDDSEDQIFNRAKDAIEEVYNMFENGGSREGGILKIGDDTKYLVTGGMSWGDYPTDSFLPICVVDILRVTVSEDRWHSTDYDWERLTSIEGYNLFRKKSDERFIYNIRPQNAGSPSPVESGYYRLSAALAMKGL